MNIKAIRILIIMLVIIFIKIITNVKGLTKSKIIKNLSEKEMDEYINDLWINFEEKNIRKYTEKQLVVISIMTYEEEVNNGGLEQFFENSSRIFAPIISKNLKYINAIKHKKHYDEFIKQNKINIDSFISKSIDNYTEKFESYPFDDFDNKFYKLEKKETLYDLIIQYAKNNYDEIFIKIK